MGLPSKKPARSAFFRERTARHRTRLSCRSMMCLIWGPHQTSTRRDVRTASRTMQNTALRLSRPASVAGRRRTTLKTCRRRRQCLESPIIQGIGAITPNAENDTIPTIQSWILQTRILVHQASPHRRKQKRASESLPQLCPARRTL